MPTAIDITRPLVLRQCGMGCGILVIRQLLLRTKEEAVTQTDWLEICARRLSAIAPTMVGSTADQVAVRLWYLKEPRSFRDLHPVAAAETWFQAQMPEAMLRTRHSQ